MELLFVDELGHCSESSATRKDSCGRTSKWANYRYKGYEDDQTKAMDSLLKHKLGNNYELVF